MTKNFEDSTHVWAQGFDFMIFFHKILIVIFFAPKESGPVRCSSSTSLTRFSFLSFPMMTSQPSAQRLRLQPINSAKIFR